MTWLRFLNPFYVYRLEQQHHRVLTLSHALAAASKNIAVDAKSLADGDAAALRAGELALRDAQAERRTVLAAMEMAAAELAKGRAGAAKNLIDGLLLLLRTNRL